MRRVAHISDLHFGAVDERAAEALLADIERIDPHLILVSGDLTQRARRSQFVAAREFLDKFAQPKVIVPGNHDIPLYNVVARFGWPLDNYREFITHDLSPTYEDEELVVAGVNTARSNTWKEGRVSPEQIEGLRDYFRSQSPEAFHILVAHHPFIRPPNDGGQELVKGAPAALRMLGECGCALVATGHLHQAYSGDARTHHVELKRAILVAQAGTAISSRRRDEPNTYNLLTIDGDTLKLEVRAHDGPAFRTATVGVYVQSPDGWILKKPTDEQAAT
jgi:3',5'-cyclic AMP phosphodiesterase CpdA